MRTSLELLAYIFGVIVIVIGVMAICVSVVQYNSCQAYAKMGIDVQYNFWTGCMANHPQFGWLPVEEYFKVLNLNIPQ